MRSRISRPKISSAFDPFSESAYQDPERAREIIKATDKLLSERKLRDFITVFWHFVEPARDFVPGFPVDAICEHLEAVTAGHISRLLINVPPGFMKLAADSTPILTPAGYRTHGDLKQGDYVFGPDGKPTEILSISPKSIADYEVTFSTHETIKCNGDHLWHVYDRFFHGWKTVDTRYMAEAATEKGRNRFFIPDTRCLEFPSRDLPLHPYFIGCWLGDGTHNKPLITHSIYDMEHIVKLEGLGYKVTSSYQQKNTLASEFRHQGIIETLREMGLYGNKHIPAAYLTASKEQRQELLAGLIDTDGTVDAERGRIMIGTCDDNLAEQIKLLVLSLGMRPYETLVDAPGYEEYSSEKIYHMIGFNPDEPLPMAISRKQVKRFDFARRKRAIVSVRKSENPEPGHCIRVARPDGLYVVGHTNVVTHNSLTTDCFWPAWEWGAKNMPTMRYVASSYSEDLTIRDNIKFRQIITSQLYREMYGDRFQPSKDQFSMIKIANNKTGWKLATSVGGIGTGERGDRIIIDDPNSVKQAESEAIRNSTNTWFREVIPTRLNDPEKSAIIVIQQRTHEEDVSGIIIANDLGYEHLMIPMEYDPPRHCVTALERDEEGVAVRGWQDPRGLDDNGDVLTGQAHEEAAGMLAWPERFPAKVVERDKNVMGPYAVAGQFQQIPAPRGGSIFNREWWQFWPPEDWPPQEPLKNELPVFDYVCASLDTAFTEKKENDYCALTIWGIWSHSGSGRVPPRVVLDNNGLLRLEDAQRPRIMLAYGWHKRLTLHGPPELIPQGVSDAEWHSKKYESLRRANWGVVEWTVDTCRRYGVHTLLVEAKASGLDVANELARLYSNESWGIQMINPRGDKVARAYAVQSLFSNGQVYAPGFYESGLWRDWVNPIIDEMASFPKGAHDDFVDSSTMALLHLREIGLAVRKEESHEQFMDEVRMRTTPKPLYPV